MSEFELWIGDVPPSFNDRGRVTHVIDRAIAQWRRDFGLLLLANKDRPRNADHAEAFVTLAFPKQRRRDVENYRPVLSKALADALVDTGVIPDDTAEHFTLWLQIHAGVHPRHRTEVRVVCQP